jgi:predicted MPP superfamily phosphohydrolase
MMGLVLLDGFWFEKYIIDWEEFDVADGSSLKIKIIQISDLHLRAIRSFHVSIAKRINQEVPDVVLITGDAITRTKQLGLLQSFLELMDASILKIAILGNKENAGRVDLKLLKDCYEAHNGVLLINQSYELTVRNRKINFLGVDDYVWGTPDIVKAAEGIDTSFDSVILNHCPAYREEIDRLAPTIPLRSALILAGHTHGGQITFFGWPLYTPYGSGAYVKGWYSNAMSKMYVSKGIGTTVLPIRFGARAEATIFYI